VRTCILARAAARESLATARESSRAWKDSAFSALHSSESISASIRSLARTVGSNRSMYSRPRDAYRSVRYLTSRERKGEKGAKGAFADDRGVRGSGGVVALAVGARERDDFDRYEENT